jgi:hypothetical protein
MSIQNIPAKIKEMFHRINFDRYFVPLLIILVGVSSFGLGRLSRLEDSRTPIKIHYDNMATTTTTITNHKASASTAVGEAMNPGGKYVASKLGTKYHFPWCAGARSISESNKVWFDTVDDAEKAGYSPASNCKGLK